MEIATHPEAKLTDPARIHEFMFAGRARFTLVSVDTGKRFTFRINRSDDGRLFFVQVLTGSDNTSDFTYLGTIRSNQYRHGAKSSIGIDAASAKAFAWFWERIARRHVSPKVEFWHEGRCGRCARPLTDPASILSGFGPECITKIGDMSL